VLDGTKLVDTGPGAPPARNRAASTSSLVKFFDCKKAIRFSRGAAATAGSERTVDRS